MNFTVIELITLTLSVLIIIIVLLHSTLFFNLTRISSFYNHSIWCKLYHLLSLSLPNFSYFCCFQQFHKYTFQFPRSFCIFYIIYLFFKTVSFSWVFICSSVSSHFLYVCIDLYFEYTGTSSLSSQLAMQGKLNWDWVTLSICSDFISSTFLFLTCTPCLLHVSNTFVFKLT